MAALSVTLDSITLLVTVIVLVVWCVMTLVLYIKLSLKERDTIWTGTHPDTVQVRRRGRKVAPLQPPVLSLPHRSLSDPPAKVVKY